MASFESVANAIRTRVKTEVGDVLGLSIGYDNADYTPPANTTFAVASVLPAARRFVTFQRPRIRGTLMVTVFAPEKTGDSAANAIVDTIADAFTGTSAGIARFETAEVVQSGKGQGNESGWWKVVVNCPFYADEA